LFSTEPAGANLAILPARRRALTPALNDAAANEALLRSVLWCWSRTLMTSACKNLADFNPATKWIFATPGWMMIQILLHCGKI
jgi:hypothetical protein